MNDYRSPIYGVGLPVEAPPSLHLAGNFRALLHRHAQTLSEPMRGAVEQVANLIDQQRASTERIQGLYDMAVRREEALLGQLSVVRHLLQEAVEYLIDAHPSGDSEFIQRCRVALTHPAAESGARRHLAPSPSI